MSVEEVRRAEADFIAARIQAIWSRKRSRAGSSETAGSAAPEISIPGYRVPGHRRPVSVSVAGLRLYEEALKRSGIPYFIVGGRGYFQRQEIYDITNILRAVFKPADRRSLVGALRSPAFGIDDLTLYESARRGTLSYLVGRTERARWAQALGTLRRLHDSAFRLTPFGSPCRDLSDRSRSSRSTPSVPGGRSGSATS